MDLTKLDLRPYREYKISDVMKIKGKLGFRVTLVYDDGTEKECQHSGFSSKSTATKNRNRIIAQLENGIYVAHRDVKIKDFLPYWLEHVMRARGDFKANSYDAYKNCIYRHIIPRLGNIKLIEVNPGHIQKVYKELCENYKSIPRIAKPVLNTSFIYAVSIRLMEMNPCENVNLPRQDDDKKREYHTIHVNKAQTYSLEQVKILIKAAKDTRIYMQILFAVLMGLRKGEINGLKYSDIDFEHRTLKIQRQLGKDLYKDDTEIPVNTKTKQEITLKTWSSEREIDIPDYVFEEILKEREKYERNKRRRQQGVWTFQDLGYICCSSYGRPRSSDYHYTHYKELIKKTGLPYIRFHDLRHTYATLLLKNEINQKAIAEVMGHSKSIITVDTYGDTQRIIEGGVEVIQDFIDEVHPYGSLDVRMLKEMFGMEREVRIEEYTLKSIAVKMEDVEIPALEEMNCIGTQDEIY